MSDFEEKQEAVSSFLSRWRRDQDEGIERELSEYLTLFPGQDSAIAHSFLRQRQQQAQSSDIRTVGPYETSHELGRGGQGIVYRARHLELGHDVALKVLQGLGPESGSVIERFYREAKVAARLNHPGICQVVDAGFEDGVPFMAMQFIEGETLDQRLRRARSDTSAHEPTQVLSEDAPARHESETSSGTNTSGSVTRDEVDRLLRMFEKVARALHAAHEAGVIHRDVKPANIMIRPDSEPVLLDFGLAHSQDDDLRTLTATGEIFGTPAYMSPEQLAARGPRLDARTDIWSLGVTLFECLAMRRPFEAPSREALYQAITTREPPALRKLSPTVGRDLAIVVAKAIEKDREHRYATAEDLAEDLRRVRELQPIRARPVGPLHRTSRWAQRNPWVASLLSITILVLTTAVILTSQEARKTARALAERGEALTEMTSARNAELQARREQQTALEAEREARRAEALALDEKTSLLTEYERLADSQLLIDAKEASDRLWPVTPELEPGLLAWQKTFGELVQPQTLTEHEAALERLRRRALPYTDADRRRDFAEEYQGIEDQEVQVQRALEFLKVEQDPARREEATTKLEAMRARISRLNETIRGRGSWNFSDADDGFRHEILARLVEDLRTFTDPEFAGGARSIDDRLQRARRMGDLTVGSEAAVARWQAAAARIEANARYRISPELRAKLGPIGAPDALYGPSGAMNLTPQLGLIPLGPDPRSGLEEFLHLDSHRHDWSSDGLELPQRRAITNADARGGFEMNSDAGLILVLVPAGSFLMGSQKDDPASPNYDPDHLTDEAPLHEVTLGAFFLSKYEFTQGQWIRNAARSPSLEDNPSRYPPGDFATRRSILPAPVDGTHPVESVDWYAISRLLECLSLELPTEAQWERAARADHPPSMRWSGVASVEKLSLIANISGQETEGPAPTWRRSPEHRDAYAIHAPVGSFEPNGFGLHDMTGNVAEWCRDRQSDYTVAPQPGDGMRDSRLIVRMGRGGGFVNSGPIARLANRNSFGYTTRLIDLGFRPVRSVATP